jgi:hypothetical protein
MQPPGRADIAAAREMFGVAQGARVLAQPGERRAAFRRAQREPLTQAAGEDRLAAVRTAQDLVEQRKAGARCKDRRAGIGRLRPRPARQGLKRLLVRGPRRCGARPRRGGNRVER